MDMDKKVLDSLSKDKILSGMIKHYGPLDLPIASPDFFALVRIIISQQLSGAAARTILARLIERVGTKKMNPSDLVDLTDEDFRKAGISGGKTLYIKGISKLMIENPMFLKKINKMSDIDATRTLMEIKGIGAWSASIFLLFDCGRKDIFPTGDASLNKALQVLYGVDSRDSDQFATQWSPYRSFASLYLWRWADNPI